jgi:hemerythrin-like domain-containing protein
LWKPKEGVRRHPALVPLSREHQHELAQARRLLRAASTGPEQRLTAASAYVEAFFAETVEHVRREEEILFPLYVRHAGSTPTLQRVLRASTCNYTASYAHSKPQKPRARSRRKR